MSLSEQFPWLEGLEGYWEEASRIKDEAITRLVAPYLVGGNPVERAAGSARALAGAGQNLATTAAAGFMGVPFAIDERIRTGQVGNTVRAIQNAQNQFGWQPSTPQEAGAAAALSAPDALVEPVREYLGEEGYQTGGPALGALGYALPDAMALTGGAGLFRNATPQLRSSDLFDQTPRLPGRQAPYTGPRQGGGIGGREGGAVKIIGRDELGREIYEQRTDANIPARRPVYKSPLIDEKGQVLDVPENKFDVPPLFTSTLPETFRRTQISEATPEEWRQEFKKIGLPDAELSFSGVNARLNEVPEGEKVSKSALIEAYNQRSADLELFNRGEGVAPVISEEKRRELRRPLEQYNRFFETYRDVVVPALGLEMADVIGIDEQPARERVTSLVADLSADMEAGVHPNPETQNRMNGIPRDLQEEITSTAREMTDLRQAVNDARAEETNLRSQEALGGPGRFSYGGEYTMGGEEFVQGPQRTLIQARRDMFGENQPTIPTHYSEAYGDPNYLNLMHGRQASRPVMNLPTFFDEAGDEWRPTALFTDEPSQGDASSKLKVEGQRGYDPTNQYHGMRANETEADRQVRAQAAEEANRLREAINDLNVRSRDVQQRYRAGRNERVGTSPQQEATRIYEGWPGSFDAMVLDFAAQIGHPNYTTDGSDPESVAARQAMTQWIDENPDSVPPGVTDRIWASNIRDKFTQYLQMRDNPNFGQNPEDRLVSDEEMAQLEQQYNQIAEETRQLNDQMAQAKAIAKGTEDKVFHEDMPMVTRGAGQKQRQRAAMLNALYNARAQGDEVIAHTTARQMAESYYYSHVGPEPDALSRFGQGPRENEGLYSYDPYYNDWIQFDEPDDPTSDSYEYVGFEDVPEEARQWLRENPLASDQWYADGREAWLRYRQNRNPEVDPRIFEKMWDNDFTQGDKRNAMREAGFPASLAGYRKLGAYEVKGKPNYLFPQQPYEERMAPIVDPENWEFTERQERRDVAASELTGNAKQTFGAMDINYRDTMVVNLLKDVLKNVLRLPDDEVAKAMGEDFDIRFAETPPSGTRRSGLYPLVNRKGRARGIEITPAVEAALDRHAERTSQGLGDGGLFGNLNPIAKQKPKGDKAKPNPGKIQKAYANGKLSKEQAIEQLLEAGVPEQAISRMIK